jgi:hypothetical protein
MPFGRSAGIERGGEENTTTVAELYIRILGQMSIRSAQNQHFGSSTKESFLDFQVVIIRRANLLLKP